MIPNRVTIFCSSNEQISDMYFSEAEILGRGLAEMGIEIVFGGSSLGVMGKIADTALAYGGRVVGVIPEFQNKKGIVHKNLTELKVVSDFYDRKRVMLKGTDAVIAFPGGVGTLDEVTEVIALKQLAEYNAPIYFINFLDSWQSLFDCFYELKERRMITQDLDGLYTSYPSSEDLIKSWLV